MSGVRSRPTIPTLTESNIHYETNFDKAELFAKKFAAVSSDDNLSDEFKTQREKFTSHLKSQSAASDGDGSADVRGTEGKNDGIFENHELLDALKACKKVHTRG